MKNVRKEIVLSLGWGISGYLSWYASLMIFSYCTNSLVPASRKAITVLGLKWLYPGVQHIAFHLTDYVLAVLIVALLTRWLGYKKITLLTFIFGATIVTFNSSIEGLSAYMDFYPKLPSWVISWFISNMVYIFLLLPLSAWTGTVIGRRWATSNA